MKSGLWSILSNGLQDTQWKINFWNSTVLRILCYRLRYRQITKGSLFFFVLQNSRLASRSSQNIAVIYLDNFLLINTSYLTDSYISFTLKLESRQKFCSNKSIRSSTYGKKLFFWNSSMQKPFSCHSFYLLVLRKITNSVTKMTIFPHGGNRKYFFTVCIWPNWTIGANNLRVKLMYESVK